MKYYVRIMNICKIPLFEYIYIFVMVLYMGQMVPETQRMNGTLSGNPIPFLIPILLTIILLFRHKVSFNNRNLFKIIVIITIWTIAQLVKKGNLTTAFLSYSFFLYYAIIISFIHIKVFKRNLFDIYEHIVVRLSLIGIIIWVIAIVIPNVIQPIFSNLPSTGYGHNFLYIYNLMDPLRGQQSLLLRNAGFSWEPGRYAICILPAIWNNIYRRGIKFKNNSNIIILLFSLLSTQSTTGIVIVISVYVIFLLKNISFRSCLMAILFVIPVLYGISQIDFIGGKISQQLDLDSQIDVIEKNVLWADSTLDKNELHVSLDRFVSAYYETLNILDEPILGYGLEFSDSYFYKNITSNFNLTGGLFQVFGKYGIIMGLYLYYILFLSTIKLGSKYNDFRKYSLFIIIMGSSISYPIFTIPLLTSIWFWGYFRQN